MLLKDNAEKLDKTWTEHKRQRKRLEDAGAFRQLELGNLHFTGRQRSFKPRWGNTVHEIRAIEGGKVIDNEKGDRHPMLTTKAVPRDTDMHMEMYAAPGTTTT